MQVKMDHYRARVQGTDAEGYATDNTSTDALPILNDDGTLCGFDPADTKFTKFIIPIPADISQKRSRFAEKRLRPGQVMVTIQYFWSWAVLYVRHVKRAAAAKEITDVFKVAHPHMVGYHKWIGPAGKCERHRIPLDAIYFAAFPRGDLPDYADEEHRPKPSVRFVGADGAGPAHAAGAAKRRRCVDMYM